MKKIISFVFILHLATSYGFSQDELTVFYGNGFPANPTNQITIWLPKRETLNMYLCGDNVISWGKTIDNYTIIKNDSNSWVYAKMNKEGFLTASDFLAKDSQYRTKDEEFFLSKTSKDLFFATRQIELLKSENPLGKLSKLSNNKFSASGSKKILMVLVNFADCNTSKDRFDFHQLMNSNKFQQNFEDYISEVSYNKLQISTHIIDWITLSKPKSYYSSSLGKNELLKEITGLIKLDDEQMADFDRNRDGIIDLLCIVNQGNGQEETSLQSDFWTYNYNLIEDQISISLNNLLIGNYIFLPELCGNKLVSLSKVAHEFGHVLGLPDFYDTDFSCGGEFEGTGIWDIMATGCINSPYPTHFTGFSKILLGWAFAQELISPSEVLVRNSETYPDFYSITTSSDNEYFLIENKRRYGYNSSIPGSGMIIYHIDGDFISRNFSCNNLNTNSHQGIYIKSENGLVNTSNCLYPGENNKVIFSDNSIPNSKSWSGLNTNKSVSNIRFDSLGVNILFDFMGGLLLMNKPIVCTGIVSNISTSGAICFGEIINDGNDKITEQGICYGFVNPPTIYHNKSVSNNNETYYNSHLKNLLPNTKYFYRAYAINSQGVGYGRVNEFCTNKDDRIYKIPFYESFDKISFPLDWISYHNQTIDSSYWQISPSNLAGGIANECCWVNSKSYNGKIQLVSPQIITDGNKDLVLSFDQFYEAIGPNLSIKVSISYDDISWDVIWEKKFNSFSAELTSVKLKINNAESNTNLRISFSVDGNVYLLQKWAIDNVSITNSIYELPEIITVGVSKISSEEAEIQASIVSNGGSDILEKGICISQTPNASISDFYILDKSNSNDFKLTFSGLAPFTQYYVRSFCINEEGLKYGNQLCFRTNPENPFNYIVPFMENFDNPEVLSFWKYANDNLLENNPWTIVHDSIFGLEDNCLRLKLQSSKYVSSSIISPQINTIGFDKLSLSFNHSLICLNGNSQLKVRTTSDGFTWKDVWFYTCSANDTLSEKIVIILDDNLNSRTTQLAFVGIGNIYQIENWYIDDVSITNVIGTPTLPEIEITQIQKKQENYEIIAKVITSGGVSIKRMGICYDEDPFPEFHQNTKELLDLETSIQLENNKTYYLRAFIEYEGGVVYSNEKEITTDLYQNYCNSQAVSSEFEWIDFVRINTISNRSGRSNGYQDFSTLTTKVIPGEYQSIYLSAGFGGTIYKEYWNVFVDLNQDGDFADKGELILDTISTKSGIIRYNIMFPSSALKGLTRLRIICSDKPIESCCGIIINGEIEDYGIEFVDNDDNTKYSSENISKNQIEIYPNPVTDFIIFKNQIDLIRFTIIDLTGVKILAGQTDNGKIDISLIASGTYIIQINVKENQIIQKFVKF